MPYYYDLVVAKTSGNDIFTYHSQDALTPNTLVKVPFRKQSAPALVWGQAKQPSFNTKEVSQVLDTPPLPPYVAATIAWMSRYYGSTYGEALGLFIPQRPDIKPRATESHLPQDAPSSQPQQLTADQTHLLRTITEQPGSQWLLHGVTGSGKTAVYIELVKRTLAAGQSSIVLVPEIALATQTIAVFAAALGDNVLITHSHMSSAQRRNVWHQARNSSEPVVIIGPRSALFIPRDDLGTIIIDECHEHSYKQEQPPHYHAREVASYIAERTGSTLLLGSATPSARDMHEHRSGKLRLLELPTPIHSNRRHVDIIDMRQHRGTLSPQLQRAIEETLTAGQQALLFLNRRGSASQVLCKACGWVASCSECDTPQTWHGDSGRLRCHWCGHQRSLPGSCPECAGMQWRFLGMGTKRIEREVTETFPDARVQRLDRDSFSPELMQQALQQLHSGDVDIIIGTQMIAKGLDLPRVNLVGVVLADTLLYIPDMSSNERTYQLLHQVIGRAGRSHDLPSRALIQTYNPEHHVITAAARHDYQRFITTELEDRASLQYPPHTHLLKLTAKRKTRSGAQRAAARLRDQLHARYPDIHIRGPAPRWRERVGDYYYWHLIITATDRGALLSIMDSLPSGWRADIDPLDML